MDEGRSTGRGEASGWPHTDGPDDLLCALAHEVLRAIKNRDGLRAGLTEPAPGNVEWSAFRLLGLLVRTGPQRASALAEAAAVDISTISRQTAELVRAGLAVREADPADGRACRLLPTPSGEAAYADAQERRHTALRRVLTDWSEDDLRSLTDLLGRFNDCVAAARPQVLDSYRTTTARPHVKETA